MKQTLKWLAIGWVFGVTAMGQAEIETVTVSHSALQGIGVEQGVMRRDPSDVIKVGDLYYVWYSKGKISPGYDATVWYAASLDGHVWTEKGMALAKGKPGTWEGASVFTPNIMVAEGRYWLFYSGVSRPFSKKPFNPDSKIGIAVSDSPNGPWQRLATNPALKNSDNPDDFDSHLVDDACLIVREGKYHFYYKGRQMGKGPGQTKMGLAIADYPQGPYVRHEANPVIPGNHEVLVWPQGKGVAAMIGTTGPKDITNSILYAEDGLHFTKTHIVKNGPWAGGAYRPEAFTQSGKGDIPQWGVEIGRAKGSLPFLKRFDCDVTPKPGAFADDAAFMREHTDLVVLTKGESAVAVAPAYQGRVMTSTYDRRSGPSFGWINRPVIEKGFLSDAEKKGKLEEHINSYNDGSPEPGVAPLGPFYELETSSPAAVLKPGETMQHVQRTFHIQGSEAELDLLARKLLGAKLDVIKAAL